MLKDLERFIERSKKILSQEDIETLNAIIETDNEKEIIQELFYLDVITRRERNILLTMLEEEDLDV